MQLTNVQVDLCIGVPINLYDYVKLSGLDQVGNSHGGGRSDFPDLSDHEYAETVYYTMLYNNNLSIGDWSSEKLKIYKLVDENIPEGDNDEESESECEECEGECQVCEPENISLPNDYVLGIKLDSVEGVTMNDLARYQEELNVELTILNELVPASRELLNNAIVLSPVILYEYTCENDEEETDEEDEDSDDSHENEEEENQPVPEERKCECEIKRCDIV